MTKVIIADNNSIFRKGLIRVLQNIGNVEIVAEVSSSSELIESIKNNNEVNVIFIDVHLAGSGGIEATREVKTLRPCVTVIGFSGYENSESIELMLEAGASGYLSKSKDNYDILTQIIRNPRLGVYTSEGLSGFMVKTVENTNINPQNLKP